MAAIYVHNSLTSPVHWDRRKTAYVYGYMVEETDGLNNQVYFMQEKNCFLPKRGTIPWPSDNSWACPLPSPLSVNGSNTYVSTNDM